MSVVYLLFLAWFIKVALVAIPLVVGCVVLFDRLGWPYKDSLHLMPVLAGYAVLLLPSFLIRKNLQWFMSLPISKRGVLALSFAVNWTMTLHVVGVVCLSVGLVYVVMTGQFQTGPTPFLLKGVFASIREIESMGRIPIQSLAFFIAAFTGFNALMLHIWAGGTTQATQSKPLHVYDPKQTSKIVLGFICLWFSCYVARDYVMTGWMAFTAVTLGICVFATHLTAYALGVFGREKKRWLTVAWIIAILELGGVYATAWVGLKSNSLKIVSESISFLGPWAG